jgi:prolyl-tRNA synthetase
VRVEVDRGRGSFGRRVTDWEIKGVPLRVEVGPRDLKEGVVTVVRRDSGAKETPTLGALAARAGELLERIQSDLYEAALAYRDDHTADVATVAEAREAAQSGFARLAWETVNGAGEAALRAEAVTVRALQRPDGTIPDSCDEAGLVCVVGKSY